MPQITFVPVAPAARLSFGFDGEAPKGEFATAPSVGWEISLDAGERILLSTGGKLKEVIGYMHVKVGTASPAGKENYGNDEKRKAIWGLLEYRGALSDAEIHAPERYFVTLHVAQQLFDRLVRLIELGRPPSVTVSLPVSSRMGGEATKAERAITYGDSGDLEWDIKNCAQVEILWCSFVARFGTTGSMDADNDEGKKLELEQLLPPTRADLTAIQERVLKIDVRLARFASTVKCLLWLIVAVLIIDRIFR